MQNRREKKTPQESVLDTFRWDKNIDEGYGYESTNYEPDNAYESEPDSDDEGYLGEYENEQETSSNEKPKPKVILRRNEFAYCLRQLRAVNNSLTSIITLNHLTDPSLDLEDLVSLVTKFMPPFNRAAPLAGSLPNHTVHISETITFLNRLFQEVNVRLSRLELIADKDLVSSFDKYNQLLRQIQEIVNPLQEKEILKAMAYFKENPAQYGQDIQDNFYQLRSNLADFQNTLKKHNKRMKEQMQAHSSSPTSVLPDTEELYSVVKSNSFIDYILIILRYFFECFTESVPDSQAHRIEMNYQKEQAKKEQKMQKNSTSHSSNTSLLFPKKKDSPGEDNHYETSISDNESNHYQQLPTDLQK